MVKFGFLTLIVPVILALTACGGGGSAPFNSAAFNVSSAQHLYVASGNCYGGGVATAAGPTNTIAKYNLYSGAFEKLIIDYNQLAPGDSPVSILDYDTSHFLVLVENAAGRRIDIVDKNTGVPASFLVNSTALNGVMRSFALLSDFSVMVSKTTAIEKFNAAKSRVLASGNPFVNAPAGSCATSTTLISSVIAHPSGKVIFTHAAASPNNKIGVIANTGYTSAADCLSGTAAPFATAMPTRAILHSSNKLLVAYGGTGATSNSVYSYDFDGSTGAISNPVAAYADGGIVVNGPSTLTEDTSTGDVFVANVTSTFNTIERFHVRAGVMTRATVIPFIGYTAYTRCVSDLKVMN